MLISGHKTRSVLDTYNIVNEEDIRDAGRKLNEHMQAKGQRETGRSNLPARPLAHRPYGPVERRHDLAGEEFQTTDPACAVVPIVRNEHQSAERPDLFS